MASSIRKAQSILQCQLCDGAVVLRWKCTTCDLLLCEECKVTRHLRVKGADKHSVIPIKDVGKTNVDDKKTEDVTGLFASLEISQPRKVNAKVVSYVLNTYTTDLPAVHRMAFFDDDKVCFTNSRVNKIIIAKLLRESIKILHIRNENVMDILINHNNNLMTTLPDSRSKLSILWENKEPKVVFDCSPLIIPGMHYNKKTNELFLGARDSGPMYQVTQYSTRPVIILGSGYKRKAMLEFSTDGKRLFTYPARIDTDENGTNYVVDSFDDENGRIVAVSRDGDLKFTYSGYKQFNTSDSPFNPTDIAVTQSNHLVVADSDNHALHIIQTDGQLVGLQDTRKVGIIFPECMCIDTEGFMLIGCNRYKDDSEGTKIHVVKLSM